MSNIDQKEKLNKIFKVGIIGAGRIAYVHAKALTESVPNAEVKTIVSNSFDEKTLSLFRPFKIANYETDYEKILQDEEIDAVYICTPTPTHVEFSIRALRAKKAVFCEKPLSLDISEIFRVKEVIEETKGHFFSAHNRRFDHDYAELKKALDAKEIGKSLQIIITSRDPELPPLSYLKVSGGIYADMMIHDIDMSRFLTNNRKIKFVLGTGDAFFDRRVKTEAQDVDTANLIIAYEDNTITTINNVRVSGYGYDQRVEVQGTNGMISLGNHPESTLLRANSRGIKTAKPMHFFLERYANAYINESLTFFQRLSENEAPTVTVDDALEAIVIAKAARKSLHEGRLVTLKEIYENN